MRMSSLFIRTLREAPSQAVLASHQYLTRAGYVQEIGKGSFALLPFGLRAIKMLEKALLDDIPSQVTFLVTPEVLSYEGSAAPRNGLGLVDSQGRQLTLAGSPDAAVDEIARQYFNSYRQLPAVVGIRHTPWEDEVHPGSGLFYSRMPKTLSLYGFFQQMEERDAWRAQIIQKVEQVLAGLDLPLLKTAAPRNTPEPVSTEWFFPHAAGRTQVYTCTTCGYTTSQENARFLRQSPWSEEPLPLEKVETPDCKTIDALAAFLQIPKEHTAKAVFLTGVLNGKEQLVIVIVPGDRELDEQRLAAETGMTAWRPALEEEISRAGVVPGYGSAVGVQGVFVAVDAQIPLSANLVAGANQPGYHLLNVNYGRDFTANLVAEITHPKPSDRCPHCGTVMNTEPAVKLAHFDYPAGEHVIMDAQGKMAPLYSAACHISPLRLLASAAENHHDNFGLRLPRVISPFQIYLVLIPDKENLAGPAADSIYGQLLDAGMTVLYDDRNERAGVKFNDADLIGIPIRITVSQRGIAAGTVEFKRRSDPASTPVTLSELIPLIQRNMSD